MRLIPLLIRSSATMAALLMLALPGRAHAQGSVNHLYDKLQFGASGAAVVLGTTIRIDNNDGSQGTEIDFNTLGISKTAFAPAVAVAWRPGRRHEIGVGYLYISRNGSTTLTRDIDFGDSTFAAGLRINSTFSAPTLTLTYRFAIMAKEKTQLGVQVGLGALFFKVGIDALAGITNGGADTLAAGYSASKSLTGPTAALGVYGTFRVGDNWYIGVNGGAIGAKVSNITASSWALGADVRWFVSRHWAFSGGWTYSGIKVSNDAVDDGGWINLEGSLKYNFNVFRLGVVYALP